MFYKNRFVYADIEKTKNLISTLLDSGSQTNFITEKFTKLLDLGKHNSNLKIVEINQSRSKITGCAQGKNISKQGNYSVSMSCLILPKITQCIPQLSFERSTIQFPENVKLADDSFNKSEEMGDFRKQ